jgi:hypothetical protein
MPRYKTISALHQKEFEQLKDVKCFVHSQPKGEVVVVQDTHARQGETATYTFIAGEEGCVESRHLPTEPLR